jgi:hypothetical protein
MNMWRRGWFVLLAVAVSFTASLQAMVVVPAEFNEMVTASQTIVQGRIVDVRSYETAGRKTIESLVTVQVVDAIKGRPGATAYFKLPGGQVGRYRRVMVGVPQFTPGDEVVLFLKGRAPAVPMPFGLTQGVYRVSRDVSGRALVMPAVAGGSGRIVRGDPARRALDLAAFSSMVRTIAGAQR